MKIKPHHRKTLEKYLKEFYKYYPEEKYTIFHLVRYLKKRIKNNRDAWIGVVGETGTGKSLMGLIIGILFGRPYDLTKNITYIPKGKEILDKFQALTRNVFQIDEAAKEMRGVNWHSKSQQAVNTAAMTERYLSNVVMLMMPNFAEFTKSMRAGSIIFRMVCLYRTKTHVRVIVQRKSRNWRSDDPWGDKAANKLYERLDRKKKEVTNEAILNIERSLPNIVMDFIIPNLELILPEITDEYKRLKLESRDIEASSPKGSIKVESRYKKQYEQLMAVVTKVLYNNDLNIGKVRVTKSEIAATLGCSVDTLNKYLHRKTENKKPDKPSFRESQTKSE